MDFSRSIVLFNRLQNSVGIEKEFEDKLAECIKNKKKYVDNDFYPTLPPNADDSPILQNAEWKYIDEVYPNKNLFDSILPSEIGQGKLGDCYLISALIYIAQFPDRVKALYNPKSSIEHGIVLIYLQVLGESLPILVDTRLPFITESTVDKSGKNIEKKKPLFACSRNDAISPAWFALIEKAYAKACGGFHEIESGQSHILLHNFLGWYGSVYNNRADVKNREKMFEYLYNLNMRNASFTCSFTFTNTNSIFPTINESEKYYGIITGHAYQILDVKKVGNMRFLKLRNPWCKFEWKGDYSRNSSMWTPELKRELNFDNPGDINEGTFWMLYEDFYRFFDQISYTIPPESNCISHSVCGVIDGYLDNRTPCAGDKNAGCLPQWNVKFSQVGIIRIYVEIAGPHAFYGINIAYNSGKKVQVMTTDMKGKRDSCDSQTHGTLFNIDKIDQPWTVFMGRCHDPATKLDQPSYFRLTIESTSDFTIQKITHDFTRMHSASGSGVFLPGGDDGCDPYGQKPLTTCRQWSFKFTKPTQLFVRVFKTVSKSQHDIIFCYTNEKISFCYKGMNAQHFHINKVSDYEEFTFDVNETEKNYSLCIYRDKADDMSKFKFIAYSEDSFEFKELPDGDVYVNKQNADFPDMQPIKQVENFKPTCTKV